MTIPIDGHCDPAFLRVKDAFSENFAKRGEPGAAVAVCVGPRTVVDLWGGWRDAVGTQAWCRDTLVNFFSVSKALCAIVALRLVEQGRLELDDPVAAVWPEFAQAGKDAITLRQILSHRAGLPALREELPEGAALDWMRMTDALARQAPWWEPGSAHGYHVNTFGFLVGELIRRAGGATIGTLLRAGVAGPLDADVHIGLAESEHGRVAEFRWPAVPVPAGGSSEMERMRFSAYWNPPGISGAGWVNRPEWRKAEIPSTNGHGTARGVARIYQALAKGGVFDGVRILAAETIAAATSEQSNGTDLISQRPSRFGLGFQLTQPERPLGPNGGAFGHFGAGGSLGFCDPESGVAFGYVTNDMGPRWQNPRNGALLKAVYESL